MLLINLKRFYHQVHKNPSVERILSEFVHSFTNSFFYEFILCLIKHCAWKLWGSGCVDLCMLKSRY